MTKKAIYVIIMAFAMMTIAPQSASAQFGLLKKLKKEKVQKPVTVSQTKVLQEMGNFKMTNRETLAAVGQAYMDQMGEGKELLATSAKNWVYKRDEFGNILYRNLDVLIQYRNTNDDTKHVHELYCSQSFNGVDYDDIVFAEDPFISESYRDRIIVNE